MLILFVPILRMTAKFEYMSICTEYGNATIVISFNHIEVLLACTILMKILLFPFILPTVV